MNSGKAASTAARGARRPSIRQRRRLQDRLADQITAFAGSMAFVYLHMAWFAAWIVINVTGWRFDPFPFGLLTLIVSLEAIFLSTFVMISQNRESARSDLRARQDFETNALSEAWLEALGGKLGVDVAAVHAAARQRIRKADAQADRLDRDNSHAGR
jgi:uncharacterized membrane protein